MFSSEDTEVRSEQSCTKKNRWQYLLFCHLHRLYRIALLWSFPEPLDPQLKKVGRNTSLDKLSEKYLPET